jgi:PKD repeat protein
MSQKITDIEGFVQDAFKEHSIQPSEGVLRKLRFKLWLRDFFSLQPNKFNVAYAGAGTFAIVMALNVALQPNAELVTPEKVSIATEKASNTEANALEEAKKAKKLEELKSNPLNQMLETPAKKAKLPMAEFVPSVVEGCAPLTVSFKNKSKNASGYTWNFGDGNSSKDKNPEYTYTKPGRYKAILSVVAENGEIIGKDQDIWVLEKPVADLDIELEKSDVETRNISFVNNSQEAIDYTWYFGDNTSSKEENPVHAYAEYASYEVKLIAKNDLGCTDTALLTNNFIEKNYTLGFPLNFTPSTISIGNNGYYEGASSGSSIFYPENYGANKYTLTIWAPNGLEVFATSDIKQGWNGYIRGRIAPAGTYTYEAKGVYPNGQKFHIKNKFKVNVSSGLDDYGY